MSINELIRSAILPIVPICEPGFYGGDATEYCYFFYSSEPAMFSDGRPFAIRHYVYLHYFAPLQKNTLAIRDALQKAIVAAGFCWPSCDDASDSISQHYVISFEHFEFGDPEVEDGEE